jgi:hypothetical protein
MRTGDLLIETIFDLLTKIATKERGKRLIANEVIVDERESLADR